MDDLISRQAAIDSLDKRFDNVPMEQTTEILLLRKDLREMPSASINCSEFPNSSDTIYRQAAIDALKGLPTWWADEGGYYGGARPPMVALLDPEDAVSAIENLPSAEPQIIRCKDCKYWIPYDWMFNEVWQSKNIADYPEDEIGCDCCDMAMKANDFCSRAERRTE